MGWLGTGTWLGGAQAAAIQAGLDAARVKTPTARCAAVAGVNLAVLPISNSPAFDGASLNDGDVFVVFQAGSATFNGTPTLHVDNGPWVYRGAGNAAARPTYWDSSAEVSDGSTVHVGEGSTYAGYNAVVTTDGKVTPGTTAVTMALQAGAGSGGGGGAAGQIVAVLPAQSPYLVPQGVGGVRCYTATGAITVDLPAASARAGAAVRDVSVSNEGGTNPVTVRTSAAAGYSGTAGTDVFDTAPATSSYTLTFDDDRQTFTPDVTPNPDEYIIGGMR